MYQRKWKGPVLYHLQLQRSQDHLWEIKTVLQWEKSVCGHNSDFDPDVAAGKNKVALEFWTCAL